MSTYLYMPSLAFLRFGSNSTLELFLAQSLHLRLVHELELLSLLFDLAPQEVEAPAQIQGGVRPRAEGKGAQGLLVQLLPLRRVAL
jgi:hypothetical protein